MQPQPVPVIVAGELAYGGRLHGAMAGTVFAGYTTSVRGLCVSSGDTPCLCRSVGGGELYYVEPTLYQTLLTRSLKAAGYSEATVSLEHGGLVLHAVAPVKPGTGCQPWTPKRPRILLVLPPLTPPPSQPLATHLAVVEGLQPCLGATAFCQAATEAEVALADLVVEQGILEGWAEELGARIVPVTARLQPRNLTVLAYAPVASGVEQRRAL